MKITNEQLLNAASVIPHLVQIRDSEGKAPAAKIFVQIGRLVAKLQHEARIVGEAKVNLFKKYGKVDGQNVNAPDLDDPNYDQFIKERDEFFADSVERTFDLVVVPPGYQVDPLVWAYLPEEMVCLGEEPKKA